MKKKILIPIIILAVILILAGGVFGYLATNSMSFSTGRCMVTSNGSIMILLDNSPIKMSNCSNNEELYEGLKTGDLIKILHDGIQESYPGGTGVYYCKKLEDGNIGDIPNDIIESLSPMGWILVDASGRTKEIYTGVVISFDAVYQDEGNYVLKINTESGFTEEVTLTVVQRTDIQAIDEIQVGDRIWLECTAEGSGYKEVTQLIEYQEVSYEYSFANMSMELPAGWAYEIREYDEESYTFGIDFWPEGVSDGKLRLEYHTNTFGVCGTGLKEEQIRLGNGLRAFQGTYDDHKVWDFISIRGLPGSYVIVTEGVDDWWDTYGEQAMEIIDSIRLAEDIIWENMAVELASQALKNEYEYDRAEFDFCTGEWIIQFKDKEVIYTVYVTADGTVRETNTFNPDAALVAKPVIYMYPEQETEVTVKLDFDGKLTSTYPEYKDGWHVIAQPDGTLTEPNTGREYYCLFWEGVTETKYDLTTGFVVAGDDTKEFLEQTLSKMGLTDKEANEFIIYWLPQMEGNAFNLISFQQAAYTDSAELYIEPAPDSILRVFMVWKPISEPIEIAPQELTEFQRFGFTVVEWGGAKVN